MLYLDLSKTILNSSRPSHFILTSSYSILFYFILLHLTLFWLIQSHPGFILHHPNSYYFILLSWIHPKPSYFIVSYPISSWFHSTSLKFIFNTLSYFILLYFDLSKFILHHPEFIQTIPPHRDLSYFIIFYPKFTLHHPNSPYFILLYFIQNHLSSSLLILLHPGFILYDPNLCYFILLHLEFILLILLYPYLSHFIVLHTFSIYLTSSC